MSLGPFLSIIITLVGLFAYWVKKRYSLLEEQGFLVDKPKFPFGNVKGIGSKYHVVEILKKSYDKYSQKAPIYGFYTFFRPNYVITGLDLLKDVLIRDFDVFRNRGLFNSKEHDPLTAHLITLEDGEWKTLRQKLTPTFTSGKMKMMFNTILDVSDHMVEKLKKSDLESVNVKDVAVSFMIEVIGNVAFGLELNTIEDPNSQFKQFASKIFTIKHVFARILLLANFRYLARKLGIKLIPTEISTFFRGIVHETVKYRLKNNIERNDFLNLLMKIGTEGREGEKKLTMDEMAAQCFVFFFAGFETSSNTSANVLYYLVKNPEIQEKLRKEIQTVVAKQGNKITYDGVQEMKYLEMVVDETLRIRPVGGVLLRTAASDYKISGTKLEIPKGSLVFIPVIHIHNDPNNYPEPEKFDPERFNDENKASRHQMAYIPFGDGPRNCIGNRFALMQIKIALVQLLTNFRFSKTAETPEQLGIDPQQTMLVSKHPVKLRAERL